MYDPTDHYDQAALAALPAQDVATVPLAVVENAIRQAMHMIERYSMDFEADAKQAPEPDDYRRLFARGSINGLTLAAGILGQLDGTVHQAAQAKQEAH